MSKPVVGKSLASGEEAGSYQNGLLMVCYVLMLALVAPTLAKADAIIYSNLGPGNTYNSGNLWNVEESSAPAMEFMSNGNYSVTQIDVALSQIIGTNGAVISLRTNAGGVPGSSLGSWSLVNFPDAGSTSDVVQSITGISGISLTAGDSYWLQADPIAADTFVGWNLNITNAFGNLWIAPFVRSDSQLGAFDVLGISVAVPEPKTLPLALTAILISLGVSLSRRIG